MAKPKIISSEPCEYRDVSCDWYGYQKWFKDEETYEQVLEDLEMFVYLLKTAYAGYDDAVKRGLDISKINNEFEKKFTKNKSVFSKDLTEFLGNYLRPYVQDEHFCIESKNFSKTCITEYRVLYSDIYVKKVADEYIVYKSDNQDIKPGDILECKKENLFLYPAVGEDVYRIAAFASLEEKEKKITVICSGNKKELLCNISNKYLWTNKIELYKEIETDDSIYVFIPTLMDLEKNDSRRKKLDENYKKLSSISERYPDKKNIILDLRTNGGGNGVHTSAFISNLYFLEKNCNQSKTEKNIKKKSKILGSSGKRVDYISPAIIQAENWLEKNVFNSDKIVKRIFKIKRNMLENSNARIGFCINKTKPGKNKHPKFCGKLIILTGKNTASSSEDCINEAKNLFSKCNQFIQIGENSAGCFNFGNVWSYQLPNSGIALHLASFIEGADGCEEGVGFIPHYWSTNDDIVKTLVNVTGDKKLSEQLKDINNSL